MVLVESSGVVTAATVRLPGSMDVVESAVPSTSGSGGSATEVGIVRRVELDSRNESRQKGQA